MDAAELEVNRLNTTAFIDANPLVVTLIPRERVSDGEGTRMIDQAPRAPQKMRMIDQSYFRGPVPGTLTGADGIQRKVAFQLLGDWDATVGLYDYWIDEEGIRCEVADLLPFNKYEVRAQVIRYGE